MRKISKKFTSVLLFLTILVSSFSMGFESKANNFQIYLSYAEPAASSTQGYLNLLVKMRATGEYKSITYFWNTYTQNNADVNDGYAYIKLYSNRLVFSVGGAGTSAYYNLNYINSEGKYSQVIASSSGNYDNTYTTFDIVGFKYSGNVGYFYREPNFIEWIDYDLNFNEDGSALLLQGILSCLLSTQDIDSSILSTVINILNSVDGLENQLSSISTYLRSALTDIDGKLESLLDKTDELIQEQKKSNTWLQKIWTSIQRLFKGDNAEDDAKVEEFGNESATQSDKINELNQQNKTEKVDASTASSDVDAHIDTEAIGNYGTVLSVFTGNTHILQYILIVLAVALIAYVLFGKR